MNRPRDTVEIIKSNKGKDKINVNGYLLCKDKNRGEVYYWICESRRSLGCNGRATTWLINNYHRLRKTTEHNHSADASRAAISKTCSNLKEMARNSNDQPVKIVQTVTANAAMEIAPCLPSRNALRQQVKHVRRILMPAEPETLNEFVLPPEFLITLNGQNFCHDVQVGEERILLFVTGANIVHLRNAEFWIMDGTFKTVPTIFRQLYSIHAAVNEGDNSSIMPLLYALMSSKSEELYTRLFEE